MKSFIPTKLCQLIISLLIMVTVAGCQTTGKPSSVKPQTDIAKPQPPSFSALSTHPSRVLAPAIQSASNDTVCIGAIADSPQQSTDWSTEPNFQLSVNEAKRRGLTPEECAAILGNAQLARTEQGRLPGHEKQLEQDLAEISKLIKKADPKRSIWKDRPWGHGGSDAKKPEDIALRFIRSRGLNTNFPSLIIQLVKATKPYGGMSSKYEPDLVEKMLGQTTKAVVEKYGNEWDLMLARAYLDIFSSDDLEALLYAGKDSPLYWKVLTKQDAIGERIKEQSLPLLAKAATEVMRSLIGYFA